MAKKTKVVRDFSGYTDEQMFEIFVAEIQAQFGCSREAILMLIQLTHEVSGAEFASLNSYASDLTDNTEMANFSVTLGFSYGKMREDDAKTLKDFDINTIDVNRWNYKYIDTKGLTLDEYKAGVQASLREALAEMQGERQKRDSHCYYFNKVLCYNYNTQSLLILGQKNKKTIVSEGEYKIVGTGVKACAKDIIGYQAGLRATKYRTFKVSNLSEVRMQGTTVEIY